MTRLEKTANAAVILTCVAFVGTLAWNYYNSSRPDPRTLPELSKGTVIKLPGSAQASPQPTLVLALSKNCHFCNESAGFYQKLTAFKNSSPQGLRMVAVLPQGKEEAASYLREQGIEDDEVISMEVEKLGVLGTPTLLLLDGQNKLEEIWVGKLDGSGEEKVIERLKKVCPGCALPKAARALPAGPGGAGKS